MERVNEVDLSWRIDRPYNHELQDRTAQGSTRQETIGVYVLISQDGPTFDPTPFYCKSLWGLCIAFIGYVVGEIIHTLTVL